MSPDTMPSSPSFLAGRRKWAILGLFLVVIAVGLAVFLRRPSTSPTTESGAVIVTNNSSLTNRPNTFRQVTVPLTPDADKDGLSDEREDELRTNSRLADSDGDELNDFDEVEVYKSDPLKQDSDGDGFFDGEEVRTGNNPNGPGSLRDLQKIISNINAQ